MHRQKSGSGFPSMSSFNGQPNKRMRVQEPAKQEVVDDFMDDDEWGELDEEAMDECMVLATQMCSQAPQNNNDVTKQDVGSNFSSTVGNTAHGENSREQFPGSYKNNFNDSGFSSVKSSALNHSRVLQNSTKLGRGVAGHSNNVSRSNSYSNRFNDFSIPETTVQKSGPSLSKTVHSVGKVYNSIPIKGASTSNSHGNTHPTTSGTATLSDGGNQVELKKIQDEKAKLQEDVLMKQGEISLLRLELKRKEAALEAERLDRCTALEAAEKRGREKVANAAAESEAKTKESLRSVERLQGELHFKNREIEELTIRCKRLEQQSTQLAPSQVTSPLKRGRHESVSLSTGMSPGKSRNNFKSHLDFGGGPVSVRTIEVQTESSQPQGKKKRSRLSLDMTKGRVTGCRRASYMLSSHAMAAVTKHEEVRASSWSLAPKWASLVSQLIAEHQDSTSVEKHLVVLAIQRLQEVQTLLTTRDPDATRVPPAQGTAPVEWYEGSVMPALSMLESLIAPYGTGHEQSALQAACRHLSPLCIKEIVVNNRVRQHVLQTLEKIASFTTTNIEAVICQQMITSLGDCCGKVDDWDDVLAMLRCLRALGSQAAFTSLLCTKAESCLIDKVCMLINKYSGDRTVTVSHMLGWLAVLVTAPPPWLRSTCYCPSKLLTCLLKQSHLILDFTKPEKILKVVKEAQLAHGLRHNDYQLYRQYCSRRIRRLRKNLKLIQGDRKNFRKKEVTVNLLKEERFLFIPLMTIERCWAYAMQLKEERLQDNRKKFSMRNKLRKAAKYVVAFEKLVEDSGVCDARTQLEVQGYSAWLQGTVLFELADWSLEWDKPVEFFNKALAIYSKLKEAVSEEESEVYTSRLQELEVKLRFCRHHLGDKMATDTLLAMRGSEALGDKLDNLLASARERQASTLSEVTWRGRTLAVKHEKVRLFLLNEGLIHEELENIESADKRVEMLDKLLMECKDALQLVRDDLKNDPTFKPRQQVNEGPVSPLHFLHTYLSYHRLNLTILRNVALVDTYQKIISGEIKVEDGKKAPKLQDLVRLQEIIIQNLNEITNLAGLEDDLQLKNSIEGQVFAYKAHRCYFVAESFVKMEKWAEALVLFERTLAHISAARKSQLDASVQKNLDKLSALVDSKKFTAHAQAILVSETAVPNISKLSLKDKKMLINRLDEYVEDPGLISNHPSIAQVPPHMLSVPCKPLFFDLALNHIDFPSLDDKIETKKQAPAAASGGLTGLVKGLWGWGSKK